MKKKSILTILVVISLILIISKYFSYNQKNNESPLIVGVMNGWAPYMSINNKGEMEGFDVDIVTEIEKIVRGKIIIKDLGALSSLFIALEQEAVDAIFSGLDVTAERKKAYNYVLYGGEDAKKTACWVFTTPKGPQNEIQLKNINNNYKMGLEAAVSWEATLDQYQSIQKVYSNSISDMVLQLEKNNIDCFVLEEVQSNRLKKSKPNLKYFKINLDDSVAVDGIGIFIKKNKTVTKETFENAIKTLEQNGTMAKLSKKWQLNS